MNIKETREISLTHFMKLIGCKEVKQTDRHMHWFLSPFRKESTASFKVNARMNLWYDFGIGEGGDIIDLGKLLYQTSSVSNVLSMIEDTVGKAPNAMYRIGGESLHDVQSPGIENLMLIPIHNHSIISYLTSRRINESIASRYCQEAHYMVGDRHYYALAFGNDSGGVEMRNPYFKGVNGPKDVTLIHFSETSPIDKCCVFEGFMDFLSYLTLKEAGNYEMCHQTVEDYLILNSVAIVKNAIPKLDLYTQIHCYLDNDAAGQAATDKLAGLFNVTDERHHYGDCKDLNEYIIRRST